MKLYDWLWVIFHPSFWIMNGRYCKVWDIKLNKLIKYPTKDNIQSINLRVAETNINAREDE